MLVVDINHWLDERGELPAEPQRLRRNALRVAQLIEYGATLDVGYTRETLVPCTKRPSNKPCPGFMWVVKDPDDRIHAHCVLCRKDELLISGWQDTVWGEGMMPPTPTLALESAEESGATRH